MLREYDVMVAGHLCLDVIPRFPETGARRLEEILRPGKLIEIAEATVSTGGAVSNTGISMRKLGNEVCFCARIGDDGFGRLILECLRAGGSAEGVRVVPGAVSSYTVVVAPPHIDRMFLHNPGANHEFGPEDLSPDLVAQCRLFHFGYPPVMRRLYEEEGAKLEQIFAMAKDARATTSLDMALPDPDSPSGKAPWAAILARVLPFVDIFLPSIEEASYMLEPAKFLQTRKDHPAREMIDLFTAEDFSRVADRLLEMGSGVVGLKAGRGGFYLKTKPARAFETFGEAKPGAPEQWASRELWCPAFCPPKLASATGSGDAAIAGFLTAFLRGLAPELALKCAACVGWQNVQELDATSGIRDWATTMELVDQGMPMYEIRIEAPGWRWSDAAELWAGPNDPLF